MNCPKCGYAQEKRLDCKKCGIVFSKYYALFPPGKVADAPPAEAPNGQELSGQELRTMVSGLQMQVQVLSNRFAEVEFEKAERNQLRLDLKNLERQLSENIGRLEYRLDHPLISPAPQDTTESVLPEMRERLEHLEAKLGSLDFAGQYIVELSEKGEANAHKISDMQPQIAILHNDFQEMKSRLEIIAQAQKVEEPRTPIEKDVHAIRKNLDELRAFLNKPIAS